MKDRHQAVIVEIRGSSAAALTEGGTYVHVHNRGYEVGQTIRLPGAAQTAYKRARVSALAAAAAFLMLFGGFIGYMAPAGVVSLDVNPSIEYTINYFDRVLDISAVNDDAGRILAGMDEQSLRYRPVDEAVEATIEQLRENGYLTQANGNDVVLSASSYSVRHAQRLAERLSECVGQQNDLAVYSVSVERNEVQNAHALGTSAGKYYLIEQLGETIGENGEFNPMDWVETPVREIIAQMKGKTDATDNDGFSESDASQPPAGMPDQGEPPAQDGGKPGGNRP